MQNVNVEPFKLIGISVRTTNKNNQAAQEIGAMWQCFMREGLLAKIPNRVDDTIYSLYTEYEGDHTQPYTAVLGCRVENLEDVPEGMVGKTIEGGNYVKTTARGDLQKGMILEHWGSIFEIGLDRTFTADFETFGEKAQNPADAEVDFYVAIK